MNFSLQDFLNHPESFRNGITDQKDIIDFLIQEEEVYIFLKENAVINQKTRKLPFVKVFHVESIDEVKHTHH